MELPRIVVLVSGSGSNLQAILDAIAGGALSAQVVAVISNRRDVRALSRAAEAGVPSEVAALKPFRDAGLPREAYDAALADTVAGYRPDLVVCAGWMHVLSPAFLDRFAGRVINLHPALPGELPGTDAIRRAWEEGQAGLRVRTGVRVHHVVPEVDAGPTVALAEVPLFPGEPLEGLQGRVHAVEHVLLVGAIRDVLEGLCGRS
jgi:formyltetrahydrofolate-dependent phosphoribosylglycinamide formyltransferase